MMVGRRWDLDWDQPLDISQTEVGGIHSSPARLAASSQRPGNYIDYFVYTRGSFAMDLLPLAISRFSLG